MPFSFPEPGVVHLVIPESGWAPDDRAAFIKALSASCAEGPTALFLESNTTRVSPEGPNLMLALFEKLQERIVCLGIATQSSLLQMTVIAFRAAAGLRGIQFPIHVGDDANAMRAHVVAEVRARRHAGSSSGPPPGPAAPAP